MGAQIHVSLKLLAPHPQSPGFPGTRAALAAHHPEGAGQGPQKAGPRPKPRRSPRGKALRVTRCTHRSEKRGRWASTAGPEDRTNAPSGGAVGGQPRLDHRRRGCRGNRTLPTRPERRGGAGLSQLQRDPRRARDTASPAAAASTLAAGTVGSR